MSKTLVAASGLIAALFVGQNCFAGIMVSLVASPPGNPVVLSAGETITIDVMVSGIGEMGNPTSLNALVVTVLFDSMSFGNPVSSVFGSIVPVPSDGVLNVNPFGGSAAGSYDISLPFDTDPPDPTPITDDGLFFRFTLTALSVPVTVDSKVAISDAGYFFTDEFGDEQGVFLDPEVIDPINVTVSAAAVPEPASWVIFSLGALGLARARNRSKRAT